MLFWPIVILVLITLSLLLSAPHGASVSHGLADFPVTYMIVFAAGITIAAAGRLLLQGGWHTARQAVLWMAAILAVGLSYSQRAELSTLYDRLRGEIHPSVALTTAQGEAELRRAWDGHYRAEAEVNGVKMRLMIDTGASMVLLPYERVRELGIDPNSLEYSMPVTTANGKSTVAPIKLSSIKIGPIAVFDVHAAVAHPGRLKVGLLGMSFLDKLDETSFKRDKLILRN